MQQRYKKKKKKEEPRNGWNTIFVKVHNSINFSHTIKHVLVGLKYEKKREENKYNGGMKDSSAL